MSIAFIAGCGGEKHKPGPKFKLVVGDIVPLSGDLKLFGPPGRKAADLAVHKINESLDQIDFKGVKVSVKHADSKTDPKSSVKAARKLVKKDKASCLVGEWATVNTEAIARSVAIPERVPLISPASTGNELSSIRDSGFIFRTAPADKLQATALAKAINQEGGKGKKVNIGARDDSYGRGLARNFKREWLKLGGKVGRSVVYNPDASDMKRVAKRLVAGSPAIFVIFDFPQGYAKLGPALVRTGKFTARRLWVSDGLASGKLPEEAGRKATEGIRGTAPGAPNRGEIAVAFDKLYRDSRGSRRQVFDSSTFDSVMLCFLAAVSAGSSEPEMIKDHLADVSGPGGEKVSLQELDEAIHLARDDKRIDYEGPSGSIDLDKHGDPSFAVYDIFTYRGGKIENLRQIQVRS